MVTISYPQSFKNESHCVILRGTQDEFWENKGVAKYNGEPLSGGKHCLNERRELCVPGRR